MFGEECNRAKHLPVSEELGPAISKELRPAVRPGSARAEPCVPEAASKPPKQPSQDPDERSTSHLLELYRSIGKVTHTQLNII